MADQQRGSDRPTWALDPYQVNVQYGTGRGIARGTGADWFGPLDPMKPVAPPDVAGRRFDFPSGYNLALQPRQYEQIGFPQLRAFADACDLLRLVIETRKDQMERQRFTVKPRDPVLRRSSKRPPEVQGRIDAANAFLRRPDGYNGWKTWTRGLLEDMFVIDAATLYCQRNRGGKLIALQQLDGATIKRVIDDWGRTPQPYRAGTAEVVNGGGGKTSVMVYPPAYQQILKGMPAVDYSTRDIIYRPRNVRAHKVYGYSPVQQILLTVQIALRRQLWQLDYYTEGSIPDALIGVPSTWSADQIRDFQKYWDTEFTGDLAKRRRAKFVPGEVASKIHQTKEPEQKNDFDEWLARVICFAFSIPPTWATKMINRSSGEKQSDQAEEEGLEPTKEWIKDLVDDILTDEMDSPDLELAWLEETDIDPTKQSAIIQQKVNGGRMTLNESRDLDGLERYADLAADKPMAFTAQGFVPIEANIGKSPFGGKPGEPLDGPPERTPTEQHEPADEQVVG